MLRKLSDCTAYPGIKDSENVACLFLEPVFPCDSLHFAPRSHYARPQTYLLSLFLSIVALNVLLLGTVDEVLSLKYWLRELSQDQFTQ